MATTPLDHTALEHLGAVYFSEETAFGTADTERRAAVVTDSAALAIGQVSVDAMTLSPIPFDARTPMQGDKTGTASFSYYLQPSATLLDELGTLPTDATMPGKIPLRVVFGGESIPDVGTQAATATSATELVCDAADGVNFPAGQVVAVYTNSTVGLEVAQVRSLAVDTITLYPALTATPATNADIVQMVCFYPTRTNSRTMSFAGGGRNTDRQYRLSGCTGSATLKFERNALAVAEFSVTAATHTGPSALSLSVARSEDPAGPPLAVRNSICWLQAVGTTTRVDTAVEAVDIALNFGNVHLTSLTGTLEGKRAAHRGEGLNEAFAKVTLTMPDNAEVFSWYAAQSELNFTFIVRAGTAAARRHVVVMAPQCVIESIPERVKGEGNLTKLKVVLRAKVSEQCSGSLTNEELAQAPFVLALG